MIEQEYQEYSAPRTDLTPRLLEQFVALVEEKHFGRAAQRLSMSQPSLSHAIRRLERTIGVPLVEHSTRGFVITLAGTAFAADARRLLDEQAAAVERARRVSGGLEGSLRIGYIASVADWYMPQLVALTAAELPGLRLHLRMRSTVDLVEAIRSGALDLALLRSPQVDTTGLEVREAATDRLDLAVPFGHRFADAGSVPLAEFAGEQFVLPSPQTLSGTYQQVTNACRQAGFTPRVYVMVDDIVSMLNHVTAGDCVGFVPRRVTELPHYKMPVVRLQDDSGYLDTRVVALSRQGADAALDHMLDLVERRRLELAGDSGDAAS